MRHIICTGLVLLVTLLPLSAQGFGFGDDDDTVLFGENNNPIAVSIGGEVSASLLGYGNDFSEGTDHIRIGDVFSGKLNFTAGTTFADAVINLKLQTAASPISIDEAYIRGYFGSVEIEGGLRKLTWGKADMLGPLDVVNPLDYTEITNLSDPLKRKIARPLIHVVYHVGSFSKLEGVFVPSFEPPHYAAEGRWVPSRMLQINGLAAQGAAVHQPDTSTLDYSQAGARFTTTIGPADFGLQYYYGRLSKPAVTMIFAPPNPVPTAVQFAYNPYHQIGIDWAQVLFGFNVRAELAANITKDLYGDDGSVYNPALVWSFGFDRSLAWGVNFNIQCNESIRLQNDRIADNPSADIEVETDMTSTQIMAAISKTFFRDELEAKITGLLEIEAHDFLIMPSLVWTKDAVAVELSGGIFGGDEESQFGQYHDNSFVKLAMTYTF